jgi:hypothetical protein
MFYIEDHDFLSQDSKKFIDNIILGREFPYFYQPSAGFDDDHNPFFCHILIKRPEERADGEKFNSQYGEKAGQLLVEFCIKNNIEVVEILRAAVNIVYNSPDDECPIHTDHDFDHKQLLIYINEPFDKKSNLKIYDWDGKTVEKETSPEKFKGVCFDRRPHTIVYPKKGDRAVMVFTFR